MVNKLKLTKEFKHAYKRLNKAQRQAVDEIEGPMIVVAGPGTGKTEVLTLRIANILLKTDTPAHAILAMTFTEAAAREMRERLVKYVGADGYYVNIGTFHAFGRGVIQEHPEFFDLHPEAEPLTDLERIQIVSQIIDKNRFKLIKPLNRPNLYVKSLIKSIQDLKREGYDAGTFLNFLNHLTTDNKQVTKLQEVQKIFDFYEQELNKQNRYDFEDMINKVIEAFSDNEDLLKVYQEKLHYFLADEYQDSNSAQNRLLFQLASFWADQANLFVVGDPDQSIYRFQGASLENALMFKEQFPKAKIIYLINNYRSQQMILDASHRVIKHNQLKASDLLPTNKESGPLISQVKLKKEFIKTAQFNLGLVEYAFVAEKIKSWLSHQVSANQIAVIYRDNKDANEIADILGRMGIKYNLEGGDDVLTTADVNKLLILFRACLELRKKKEDLDLFTIFNYPFCKIDPLDTLKLSRFASEKQINFLEALNDHGINQTHVKDLDKMKDLAQKLISWGQLDTEISFVEMFEHIFNDSGLLDWILDQPDAMRRLNRVNSLFREVKQLNNADHSLNLEKFLHSIELMKINYLKINEDDLDIDVDAIRLSTAHKAKGREFEYVVIMKAYDGKWGNKRVPDLIKLPSDLLAKSDLSKKEKNEDERRLFYVSMTRAKKECWVTCSTEYEDKQVVPTMFLEEIPKEMKEEVDTGDFQMQSKRILKDILKVNYLKIEMTKQEKIWLGQILANYKLNPTALNVYLQCAYKFKLDNILRTPAAKPAHMAFGTAVHKALERFFNRFKNQGKPPPLDYLLTEFEHALTQEVLTKDQYKEWQEKGAEVLQKYFNEYGDKLQKPIMSEKFFGGKFNPVYLGDIGLTGKVDKIEISNIKDQKSKINVRLIDYKTGRPRSRNEIEGKTKNSDGGYKRQLVFYQLLAELDKTFPYSVKETELDFIEANERGYFKKEPFIISQDEVSVLKDLIRKTMAKIRNQEFSRTTDYRICVTCQYKNHCWPEGVPRRKSN